MEWPPAAGNSTLNGEEELISQHQLQHLTSVERDLVDYVEMACLSLLIAVGTALNSLAFRRLIRCSRGPCPGNAKSLLRASLQMNSFTMLKFNLAITDFAILLVHALGKLVWLLSYRWLLGDLGCRLYQFLSAFSYYSNSNIVIAIGIDRLKVVYSSRVQGTVVSIRRVRLLLTLAWALAFLCALPQLFFWTSYELGSDWSQCTTIWQIADHLRANSSSSALPRHWLASRQTQLYYELLHQATVFVIPFISLFASYLLVVLRVLRYTLQPNLASKCSSYSSLIAPDNWSAAADDSGRRSGGGRDGRNGGSSPFRLTASSLKGISSRCFLKKLHLLSRRKNNNAAVGRASPDRLAVPTEVRIRLCTAPPPSPNNIACAQHRRTSTANNFSESNQNQQQQCSRKGSDVMLVSRPTQQRKLSAEPISSSNCMSRELNAKRSSLNLLPSMGERGALHCHTHHFPPTPPPHPTASLIDRRHRHSVGKPSLSSASGAGANSPAWRRQLRSKVFLRALLIVAAHCAFWLPYNLLNLLRFADESTYGWLVERGGLLVEDLIVMNAMINPILYGHGR